MTDILVTLPKSFGLQAWINEGTDLPGALWSGEEWHFYMGGSIPTIEPGERVYVCYNGKLRGYAPLVRVERYTGVRYALIRHGGAVACTIPYVLKGFRGFQYRWWEYSEEQPFPEWMIP